MAGSNPFPFSVFTQIYGPLWTKGSEQVTAGIKQPQRRSAVKAAQLNLGEKSVVVELKKGLSQES